MDDHAPTPPPVEPQQPPIMPEPSPEFMPYEPQPATPITGDLPAASLPATAGGTQRPWVKWTALVVGIALLLGGSLAYGLVYQNPQKVITDSLVHALQAKTATYSATIAAKGESTATISIDGAIGSGKQSDAVTLAFTTQGKSYTVKGAAVVDATNDVYVKVTNVNDLVKQYRASLPAGGQELLDKLVAKINNNWIKLTPSDLKNYNSGIAAFEQCSSVAITTLQTDDTAARQLGDMYKKHQFITIIKKLGSKNGSLGYQLSVNRTEAQAFMHDVSGTSLYKALHTCNPSLTLNINDFLGDGKQGSPITTETDLWVSQWSHQVTSLNVTVKDTKSKTATTFSVVPHFNVPVSVTIPTKTTTVTQLMSDVEDILHSALTTRP